MVSIAETKFKISKAFSKSIKIIPKDIEAVERINLKNKLKVSVKAKNKGVKKSKICKAEA